MWLCSRRFRSDDWTLDDLPDRIAEVRQLYLDTLADWPVDQLPDASPYRPGKKAAPKKAPRKSTSKAAKAGGEAKAVKKTQPKTPSKATKAQPASARRGRRTSVTAPAADTGNFSTTDDTLVSGVGVLAGGIGAARGVVGPATGRSTPTPSLRCCRCRPPIRRPRRWRSWSNSWSPMRTGRSCRSGSSGCRVPTRRR